jgi:ribonuclease VapC
LSPDELFDASAVLALVHRERGWEKIPSSAGALISAVNLAEVIKKLVERGMSAKLAIRAMKALNLTIVPFETEDAFHSSDFIHRGISLGDRACLGTAQHRGYRVITADSTWTGICRDVKLHIFR